MPAHDPGDLTGDGEPVVAGGRQEAVAPPVQSNAIDDLHGMRFVIAS